MKKKLKKIYLASTDMKGNTKIGSKMPNFTNSFVLEILISGTPHLAILDCGATRSLITTAKYQEIFSGKVDFLKPPPNINFFGADGNSLIITGLLTTNIKIGKFSFVCELVVYQAPQKEILLAYDLFLKYKFLMSKSHFYVQ